MVEEKQIDTTSSTNDVEQGLPESASEKLNDVEKGLPESASEKLEELDKKTYVFAGYIFWGILFVAVGATAAALLSQKTTTPQTEIPSAAVLPTETIPSESATNSPSQSPTVSPFKTLQSSVAEKLEYEFAEKPENKFDGSAAIPGGTHWGCKTVSGHLSCKLIMYDAVTVKVSYKWGEGEYTSNEGVGTSESTPFSSQAVEFYVDREGLQANDISVAGVDDLKGDELKGDDLKDALANAPPKLPPSGRYQNTGGMFEAGFSSMFGSSKMTMNDYDSLIRDEQEAKKFNAFNDQVEVIFPTRSSIRIYTLNENCGIECFEDSLDDYLNELDGALKQVEEAYKEIFS